MNPQLIIVFTTNANIPVPMQNIQLMNSALNEIPSPCPTVLQHSSLMLLHIIRTPPLPPACCPPAFQASPLSLPSRAFPVCRLTVGQFPTRSAQSTLPTQSPSQLHASNILHYTILHCAALPCTDISSKTGFENGIASLCFALYSFAALHCCTLYSPPV